VLKKRREDPAFNYGGGVKGYGNNYTKEEGGEKGMGRRKEGDTGKGRKARWEPAFNLRWTDEAGGKKGPGPECGVLQTS